MGALVAVSFNSPRAVTRFMTWCGPRAQAGVCATPTSRACTLLALCVLLLLPSGTLGFQPSADHARLPVAAGSSGPLYSNSAAMLVAEAKASLAQTSAPPNQIPAACAQVHQAQYPELSPGQWTINARCAYEEARASVSAAGWVLGTGNPPPFYLYDFVVAYDSTDHYVVLFGAPVSASPAAPAETWSYSQGHWAQLNTGSSPASCLSSSFADDPADGYVVYFAGTTLANLTACPSAGQTWTFHGGKWSELTPAQSPSQRYGASLSNDSAGGYLVLFGGVSTACGGSGHVCGDTWKFSGGAWTQLAPATSPSNRSSAGMTYDARDGYILLFGGEGANGTIYTMLSDTWAFAHGNWTRLTPSQSPPQPAPDGLAYDPADGYAIYTQVCQNISNSGFGEVIWKYAAGNWSALNGSCGESSSHLPSQRLGEGTTYDPTDGYFLMFGGGGIYGEANLNDTWSYRNGNWTSRTVSGNGFLPENGASITYDAADDAVLLFGGFDGSKVINTTWEYSNGTWTLSHPTRSPSARTSAGMAYDASDGYVVLFGGFSPTNALLGDTWEFISGDWTELTPTTSPSPRAGPGLVYDGADGYILLFGGGAISDTWTFHAGVWTNITATTTLEPPSPGIDSNPLAYDAADGYVLYYDSVSSSGNLLSTAQTWGFKGGHWTNLTSSASAPPAIRQNAAISGMGSGGGVLFFGGNSLTGNFQAFADTWVFSNGTWSEQQLPFHPSARYWSYLVYDGQTGQGILFGGSGPGSPSRDTDTWLWEAGAAPSPFVTSFTPKPGTLDEGTPTILSLTVEGGTPPLSFAYAGLPSGCPSQNVSALTCTPAPGSAGTYQITGTVTDALGNRSSGFTAITVEPRPAFSAFSAGPARLDIGNRTVLVANVSGGTSPYSYQYTGLPPGCTSQTVPTLPCIPTTSGNYTVTVSVQDGSGAATEASLSLTVTPLTAGGLSLYSYAASPPALILGNVTELNATATSTVGPVTYQYLDLPVGCSSENSSSLACQPTAAGSFSPTLNVSDPRGDHLQLSTDLTIYPVGAGGVLSIQAYAATPSTIALGETLVIYVSASGGSGNLTYEYSGLPAGCATQDLAVLPCSPTATGNFQIAIEVNDLAGHSVRVETPITVLPATGSSIPLTISAFSAGPSTTPIGRTVEIEVSAAGGTPPIGYSYTGLPKNCSSVNVASFTCVPEATGTFTLTATVRDASGKSVSAVTFLTVTGPPNSITRSTPASFPIPALDLALAIVGAGAAFGAVFLGVGAYRKRPPSPGGDRPPQGDPDGRYAAYRWSPPDAPARSDGSASTPRDDIF
jgi:hypothetical protein